MLTVDRTIEVKTAVRQPPGWIEHSLARDRTDSVLADIRHKVYQEFELIHEEIRDYSI